MIERILSMNKYCGFIVSLAVALHSACGDPNGSSSIARVRETHPDVLTVLFGSETTCGHIIVVHLRDTAAVSVRGSSTTIVNLNGRLIVAEKMTLQSVKDGSRIKLELSGGVIAPIPCFDDKRFQTTHQVMKLGTNKYEFHLSDIIRINGVVMSYEEAARKYPRIAKRQEKGDESKGGEVAESGGVTHESRQAKPMKGGTYRR